MRIVVQRAKKAEVRVRSQVVGSILEGLVLFVCLEKGDTLSQVEKAALKILKLRCFLDPETGKMSHSLLDGTGDVLAISQFTLSWKGSGGNRPGFELSMEPEEANQLFEQFCETLQEKVRVETGRFGEYMEVDVVGDGPVTFCLDF